MSDSTRDFPSDSHLVIEDPRRQSLVEHAVHGIKAARNRVALMLAQQDADVLRRVHATQHMLQDLVQSQVHPSLVGGIRAALSRYEEDAQRLTAELQAREAKVDTAYQRLVAVRTRLAVLRGDQERAQRQWVKAKDAAADRAKSSFMGRLRGGEKLPDINADFIDQVMQMSREIAEVAMQEADLVQEKLRLDEQILKLRTDLMHHANQASAFVSEQVHASRHLLAGDEGDGGLGLSSNLGGAQPQGGDAQPVKLVR